MLCLPWYSAKPESHVNEHVFQFSRGAHDFAIGTLGQRNVWRWQLEPRFEFAGGGAKERSINHESATSGCPLYVHKSC